MSIGHLSALRLDAVTVNRGRGRPQVSEGEAKNEETPKDSIAVSQDLQEEEAGTPEKIAPEVPRGALGGLFDGIGKAFGGILEGIGKAVQGIFAGIFGKTTAGADEQDGEQIMQEYEPKNDSAGERARAEEADKKTSVIFVNGAGTHREEAVKGAEMLSGTLGRNVDLIHNATAMTRSEGGLLSPLINAVGMTGFLTDLQQVGDDHAGRGTNQCVEEVKNELRKRLMAGEDVDIIGHSQGTTIIARAIKELNEEHNPGINFQNLHVINMGGTAERQDYGTADFNYDHVELPGDHAAYTVGELVPEQDRARRDAEFDELIKGSIKGFLAEGGNYNRDHDPRRILDESTTAGLLNIQKIAKLFDS
ncbi:MAG: PE-PPE domain-containing protein [Candidatus Eremiobacteraeota bacterium]|nr:PE-PPE domain-containing protein [Candidatus Eremiobacteraeota bacterium]